MIFGDSSGQYLAAYEFVLSQEIRTNFSPMALTAIIYCKNLFRVKIGYMEGISSQIRKITLLISEDCFLSTKETGIIKQI